MIGLYARRRFADRLSKLLMPLAACAGLFFLGWILWTSFAHGLAALRWDLFVNDTPPPGTDPAANGGMFAGSSFLAAASGATVAPCNALTCCGVSLPPVGGAEYVSFSSQVTRPLN